jgi:hypothetical protein
MVIPPKASYEVLQQYREMGKQDVQKGHEHPFTESSLLHDLRHPCEKTDDKWLFDGRVQAHVRQWKRVKTVSKKQPMAAKDKAPQETSDEPMNDPFPKQSVEEAEKEEKKGEEPASSSQTAVQQLASAAKEAHDSKSGQVVAKGKRRKTPTPSMPPQQEFPATLLGTFPYVAKTYVVTTFDQENSTMSLWMQPTSD